jgi:fimbrial chaperone protein
MVSRNMFQRSGRSALRLLAALGAASSAFAAHAAAVVLWPVNPTIAADQQASALWLENRGDTPVTLQVRAFGWSQTEGADRYDDQDEVVSSPPIATVAPGKRQLVRVIRRDGSGQKGERSYRLLIDQLPPPPGEQAEKNASAHLSIQLRYSIPLFTYGEPIAAGSSSLSARIALVEGKRFVEIRNSGARHARLINLRLVNGSQRFDVTTGLVGYVLPGATMRWPLPSDAPLAGAVLVNVNGADQQLSPNA